MSPANELSIKAASVWLPPDAEGPADGELSPSEIEGIGVAELPVATEVAPPQMAVMAAKRALEGTRVDPAGIGYLVHAFLYHQGYDVWSPAHYIANQTGIIGGLPINVQQLSNGGALALHLAATWLTANPDAKAALVTTADRFSLPGFNRWTSDDEAVYADSATAVLLGRRGGDGDLLHLLALEMATDPEWEVVYRGDDDFSPAPLWHSCPVDIRRPRKVFVDSGGPARMAKAGLEKLQEIVLRSLHKANVEAGDIRCVAIPRLTRHMRENVFMPAIGLLLGREPLYLECPTGHLGAGDFLANMADMVGTGRLGPGDVGLIIQGGGGFTFSCAIVQVPQASR